MNRPTAPHVDSRRAFLAEDYADWSASQLLTHFQTRRNVHYFPRKPGKAKHLAAAGRILDNVFVLNNEIHVLSEPLDWRHNPSADQEWAILLHKFYYLRELALAYDYTRDERYAAKWVALLDGWMVDIPAGYIDSQVTGRRLQQWLLAFWYFVADLRSASVSADFLARFLESVQVQTDYLIRHLTAEGNHRTLELTAVFFISVCFPELAGAAQWRQQATGQLLANMRQDLLADGVHRELSSDYHHTVLKNYLRVAELAALNGIELPSDYHDFIRLALRFSVYVHKPDGAIPAISDGDANSYLSLLKSAGQLYPNPQLEFVWTRGEQGSAPTERSRLFPRSGYSILRGDWNAQPFSDGFYLFFDCGPLGFGSHGHYDLLNIEAAAFGRSLVVDPGRYTYSEASNDGINWRHAFKGTAAHNTVMVDGRDQARYRCGRPEGREPRAEVLDFVSCPGFDFARGRAISPEYPAVHERAVYFAIDDYWVVCDFLTSEQPHRYDLNFHLAPQALNACQTRVSADGILIHSPNLLLAQPHAQNLSTEIVPGFVSPEYGRKLAAPVVRFTQDGSGAAVFQTVLLPFRDRAPEVTVSRPEVFDRNVPVSRVYACALSLEFATAGLRHRDELLLARQPAVDEYQMGDIRCRTRVLFVRRNASGAIRQLNADGLESLTIGSARVWPRGAGECRLSFRENHLHVWRGETLVASARGDWDALTHAGVIERAAENRPC